MKPNPGQQQMQQLQQQQMQRQQQQMQRQQQQLQQMQHQQLQQMQRNAAGAYYMQKKRQDEQARRRHAMAPPPPAGQPNLWPSGPQPQWYAAAPPYGYSRPVGHPLRAILGTPILLVLVVVAGFVAAFVADAALELGETAAWIAAGAVWVVGALWCLGWAARTWRGE
jgi:hypothetical protein